MGLGYGAVLSRRRWPGFTSGGSKWPGDCSGLNGSLFCGYSCRSPICRASIAQSYDRRVAGSTPFRGAETARRQVSAPYQVPGTRLTDLRQDNRPECPSRRRPEGVAAASQLAVCLPGRRTRQAKRAPPREPRGPVGWVRKRGRYVGRGRDPEGHAAPNEYRA
jgi:hypothetical protein